MAIKITDLVDQQAMQQLTDLATKFDEIKAKYVQIATELIAGINIKVTVVGDLERLDTLVRTTSRQLIDTSKQMTAAVEEQQQALKRTTSVISEQLQKAAEYNRGKRQMADADIRASDVAKEFVGSMTAQAQELANITRRQDANSKAIRELKKSYSEGRVSVEEYEGKLTTLLQAEQRIKAEKENVTKLLRIEAKEAAQATGSYYQMSQQLELYKVALKSINLSDDVDPMRVNVLTQSVQALSDKLKMMDEIFGDHQRNVGDYAIANGQAAVSVKEVSRYLDEYKVKVVDGVAVTDDINRVLAVEATTAEQCVAQNKALEVALSQLNVQESGARDIMDAVNAKIDENKLKILDVDGIMATHANTIKEAEAQNRALAEAQKLLNLSSDEAKEKHRQYGERIAENRRLIDEFGKGLQVNETMTKAEQKAVEDLSTALNTTATNINDAQAQNQILKKAMNEVAFGAEDASERLRLYGQKIAENDALIANFKEQIRAAGVAENEQNSALDALNAGLRQFDIAVYNGIASAEDISRVLSISAVTTEDLEKQISSLEKALKQMNPAAEGAAAQMEQMRQKIADNKAAINDVSDIFTTTAKSIKEMQEQQNRLNAALSNLNVYAADAPQKIAQYNAKIEELQRNIDRAKAATTGFRNESEGLVNTMGQMLGINSNLGRSFSTLAANASNGGSVITGLTGKVKAFGATALSLLTNPYMLAFLGIAGVVAGVKWWYDYNKGLVEASRQTKYFTGLTGDAMRSVRDHVQAVADTFDKDFTQTLKTANAVAKNMGTTVDEATDLIAKGFAAGGVNSEQFLSNLERYAPTFQKMGVGASEFVALMSQIDKAGVNSSRALTAMSKASLQLRTMNLKTSDSLKAIGINATQMTKDIQTGSKTTTQAMSEIAQKIQETGTNSRETAAVMKELFGARGESAIGEGFLDFLANANTDMEELLGKEDSFQRLKLQEVETDKELNDILAAMFDMTGGGFESVTTKCKIWIKQGLIQALKWVANLINGFVDWYNESNSLRKVLWGCFAVMRAQHVLAAALGKIIVGAFKAAFYAVDSFANKVKAAWQMVSSLYTLFSDGPDAAIAQFKQGLSDLGAAFKADLTAMGKNAMDFKGIVSDAFSDIGDIVDNAMDMSDRKINYHINIDAISDASTDDGGGGGVNNPTVDDPTAPHGNDSNKKDKKDKAAEKAAKEALKLLQDLNASEVELMDDGLEKTLATIRLNYKKKIDEIKGNSENEEKLRINLAKQMNNDIAKATYLYERNRAETDLKNRLASVEEGSKEEYDIKLKQLRAQRDAEIREAQKTGVDISYINAKFQKQEDELLENHNKKKLEKMAETAATEQVVRDNALKEQLNTLNEQQAEELAAVGNNEEKIAEIKERYQIKVAELQEQYAIQTANAQLEALKKQLAALNIATEQVDELLQQVKNGEIENAAALLEGSGLSHDDALNLAKSLASAELDIDNAVTDAKLANIGRVTDASKKASEKRIANAEKWLDAAADACSNITDLVSTLFDGQIQKIEEEEEANQQKYDAEIAAIDMMAEKGQITEDEAAIRKRAIEEENAKKEEELAKRKAKLQYKQAVAEKANSIAQIGIATALGIMKAAPNWVNMALVAAMGAIQLATAIAQPIKAYKEGTDYHPGGLAVVGDGGKREVVESKGKYWITPKVPTLVNMPEGSKVFPDFLEFIANEPRPNYGDILAALPLPDITPLLYASTQPQVIVNNDYRALQRDIREQSQILKAMIKQDRRLAAKAKYDRYRAERI